MQIIFLGFSNVLSEQILHHHSALLRISRLTVLVVNICHAKSGFVAFCPFEIAGVVSKSSTTKGI
jgi:hypothetical protein